ncbi:hypothetical protein [Comamonas odontotermitis]|uniref:hypothetical protein n=1 Tax=Comamonas odontotermitis TaxID=379895 RepID=UPI00375168A8
MKRVQLLAACGLLAAASVHAPIYAQGPQPGLRDTEDCRLALRDLDAARSAIARNEAEKRDQVNAAIAKANAACGSSTELLQPPAKAVQPIVAPKTPTTITNCNANYCYDSQGGIFRKSSNPNMLTGPDGRVCHRSGNVLNC